MTQPRGKTTPASTAGSFTGRNQTAPADELDPVVTISGGVADTDSDDVVILDLDNLTRDDSPTVLAQAWANARIASEYAATKIESHARFLGIDLDPHVDADSMVRFVVIEGGMAIESGGVAIVDEDEGEEGAGDGFTGNLEEGIHYYEFDFDGVDRGDIYLYGSHIAEFTYNGDPQAQAAIEDTVRAAIKALPAPKCCDGTGFTGDHMERCPVHYSPPDPIMHGR